MRRLGYTIKRCENLISQRAVPSLRKAISQASLPRSGFESIVVAAYAVREWEQRSHLFPHLRNRFETIECARRYTLDPRSGLSFQYIARLYSRLQWAFT